jgi:thioredoxin 2
MEETTTSFVCPNCTAVNRVPDSRLSESPVCGKCNTALLPDHPVELTDENFQKFIERTGVMVVVDFWATWCPPCRMMAPEFVKAAKSLSPHYMLAKLNTEEAPRSAGQFDIQGIPCLVAFRNGIEVARQSGAMRVDEIVRWVKSVA